MTRRGVQVLLSSILLHHIFRLHIALSARSTLAFLLISISAYIRTFRLVNAYTAQPVVSEIINNLCGHQGQLVDCRTE